MSYLTDGEDVRDVLLAEEVEVLHGFAAREEEFLSDYLAQSAIRSDFYHC